MLKNKFFAIFFTFIFLNTSFIVFANEPSNANFEQNQNQELQLEEKADATISPSEENLPENTSVEEVKTPIVQDIKTMTPNANAKLREEVVNDTKSNLEFTLKKFGYAMLGVLVSSIIIFLILLIMNKLNFIQRDEKKHKNLFLNKEDINVPTGENDALKVFFDKTR